MPDLHLPDHGARIRFTAARPFERDQRRAQMHDVARLAEQPGDAAGLRRRDLDDGLGGLDRDQRLIGLDGVAGLHVPLHDLRLLQPFAEIRQFEDDHRQAASRVFLTAARMRSTPGRYWFSSLGSGMTTS